MLSDWPAGVQERWFARLYFLKPAMLSVLAAFWFLSGLIGLSRVPQAMDVLSAARVSETMARLAVVGGSLADMALGLAVCRRDWAARALQGMLLVSAAYMLGGTLLRPDLWMNPLGPFVKTIPAAVLALTALAMLDER